MDSQELAVLKTKLEWLVNALNTNAVELPKTFKYVESKDKQTLAIECPSSIMLHVAKELEYHGWLFKVSSTKLHQNTTFSAGTDVTESVRYQLNTTVQTAVSQLYVDQANEMLAKLDKDPVITTDCVICQRLDNKMPIRIVRNKAKVFIELSSGS